MTKIKIPVKTLMSYANKAVAVIGKGAKSAGELVKKPEFLQGAFAVIVPAGASTFFMINKLQKEAAEKEKLYKDKLQKHSVLIKQLAVEAESVKSARID